MVIIRLEPASGLKGWFLCSMRGPHEGRMEDDIISNKTQESSSSFAALMAPSVNSLPDVGWTGGKEDMDVFHLL